MSYDYTIGVLDDESVLVECGPMRLVIRAWHRNQPQLKLARQAGEKSISYLEQIARWRRQLRRPLAEIINWPGDNLAVEMITSVKTIGDDDLTPMAAVAGTIADAVADWLFDQGATRVIVENGGDIAVRLVEGESANVGIRPQINSRRISHVIRLEGSQPAWGVTTSGVGGRSLTRGIASAVTVLATRASVADAAATAIGNACFVEDKRVVQSPAESLDPHTDIAGLLVTTSVGELQPGNVFKAVENARQRTERLTRRGIILGAFIALQDEIAISDGLKPYVSPVNE
ncbi:hypothetical protein JY97_06355 [Alkalispirochaeta odontotermitis]|nr:hypothetical protein JY97_06355 [Alkalispirochaeta odontotermitis]CAB1077906.1 FIG00845751: hypothetical protein [Olavius algarvensis Delta 1 endosymbiont]